MDLAFLGRLLLDRGRDFDVHRTSPNTWLGLPRQKSEDLLVCSRSVVFRWRLLHWILLEKDLKTDPLLRIAENSCPTAHNQEGS